MTAANFYYRFYKNNSVDTKFVEIIDGIASGMSVATMDAEGDYGAVVVSNANLRINPNQFDNDDILSDVSMLLLQNEVPEVVNLNAALAAKNATLRSASMPHRLKSYHQPCKLVSMY